MLTYIPVKYCGYILVSFEVVVYCQYWTSIQYLGRYFIGHLTHASIGVLNHFMYLFLVILSVQCLVLSGNYLRLTVSILI